MAHLVKVPSPFRSYPPGWETFDHFALVPGPGYMGFAGSVPQINRFAARYRAAKCFSAVSFDELTRTTVEGYSALVNLLLTYSAFEHFLRCIGLELKNTTSLLDTEERDRVLAKLRALTGSDAFFAALRQHLEPRYQRQVDAFRASGPCNPIYLAASVRHAFAHGHLAASPQGVPPDTISTVSRYFCRVLFKLMDREFGNRITAFKSGLQGPDT
jgi:hypothetical protein